MANRSAQGCQQEKRVHCRRLPCNAKAGHRVLALPHRVRVDREYAGGVQERQRLQEPASGFEQFARFIGNRHAFPFFQMLREPFRHVVDVDYDPPDIGLFSNVQRVVDQWLASNNDQRLGRVLGEVS